MGLDSFLFRKTYVRSWNFAVEEAQNVSIVVSSIKQIGHIDPKKVTTIIEEVLYWRKSNHIHKWFVDNIQGGNDDCGSYTVMREQLEQLMLACKQVIDVPDTGPSILPTVGGFFFGNTDYNAPYMDDIKYTYNHLKEILANSPDDHSICFKYSSSW